MQGRVISLYKTSKIKDYVLCEAVFANFGRVKLRVIYMACYCIALFIFSRFSRFIILLLRNI